MESKPKPGPDADRLQIEGDWHDAVKKALGAKKPEGGWPEPEPRKKAGKAKKKAARGRAKRTPASRENC